MNYRKLSADEINQLKNHGCNSDDWNLVNVAQEFSPQLIRNVNFNGNVLIGRNVTIQNVTNLSGYEIEDDVLLYNIDSLAVEGETSFGNGIKICALNEGGGRELMIYDRLSAQIAYMLVTCRDNPALINSLEKRIEEYCESRKSPTGLIGKGTSIKHSGILKNIRIEGPAKLEGVTCLKEGTISSSKDDPVYIGSGVTAKEFIIQSGSNISDGALIDNCFIGQGVKIGKQYSAENCAFFCNCEGFHGEAVSIFAGPYTVTHHKSTLLIAAMFSFYNAGSGTNQSNHMYKLGPLHQGILERGSKTGSLSYMLWPSRVGPFSVVIGKHYTNFDASDFPFSYLNEEGGKSLLTPAMNMFTVGTRRDTKKWQTRDRRKDSAKHDILHFDMFNPYIVGKMIDASKIMTDLLEKASKDQDMVTFKGLHIKRLLLKTCTKYYEMGVKIYIGQELIKRLGESSRKALSYDPADYSEKWIDAAGMFIPKNKYKKLIDSISGNEIKDIGGVADELRTLDNKYTEYSWAWCAALIEKRYNVKIAEITKEQIAQIISDWQDNSVKLNNMILKDAEKEFDKTSKIGFGVDGDDEIRDLDFENVRGKYEENKFVIELKKETEEIRKTAEKLL
ncbi:MAG: DUF4954 family protein [Ignavibacteriaceae bacterium]